MTPTYDPTPREDERAERLLTLEQRAALRVVERDAFDRGARAMQQRVTAGIRLWWAAAPAGHRHPGHPHILEVRVREIRVEELEGRP